MKINNKTNRVVVVGASGFVGGRIAEKLKLIINKKIIKYGSNEINLLNPETWKNKIMKDDIVIVASGLVDGSKFELEAVNVIGLGSFAQFCKDLKVEKFILISTGAVYGESIIQTYPGLPLNPNTEYGKSKLLGEQIVKKAFPNNLNILRLYFPYGPGEKSNRLVPRIKKNIIENRKIICRSDGGPFLSMMHIDDMAEVICKKFIIENFKECEVNIASDKIIGIRQLALSIADEIDKKVIFDEVSTSTDIISVPFSQGKWRDFINY